MKAELLISVRLYTHQGLLPATALEGDVPKKVSAAIEFVAASRQLISCQPLLNPSHDSEAFGWNIIVTARHNPSQDSKALATPRSLVEMGISVAAKKESVSEASVTLSWIFLFMEFLAKWKFHDVIKTSGSYQPIRYGWTLKTNPLMGSHHWICQNRLIPLAGRL